MMDYLVNQIAVMNAYAMLCPSAGEAVEDWAETGLKQLKAVRSTCKALRDGVKLLAGNIGNEGPD